MAPRKAYSFKYKLDVIAYAKAHNVSAAAEKFGVARKCVRRWKSHEGKIRSVPEAAVTKKMRLPGGGRKIALPELEEDLYKWILEELLELLLLLEAPLDMKENINHLF